MVIKACPSCGKKEMRYRDKDSTIGCRSCGWRTEIPRRRIHRLKGDEIAE